MSWRTAPALLLLLLAIACSATAAPAAQPEAPVPAPTPSAPTVGPTQAPQPIAAQTLEATLAPTVGQQSDTPAEPTSAATLVPGSETRAAVPPDAISATLALVAAAPTAITPPDGTIPTSAQPASDAACSPDARPDPLPAPGSARSQDFFRSFREPLAPAPLYDPPGPKRVGLQAGHWLTNEVPPELGRLQGGAVGGGKQEWQVNLDVAQRTAALLEASGVQVDVLPSTVPPGYRANAFIAIHADGDPAGQAHGFKVARPGFSSIPDVDDKLVDTLNRVYGADTELPRDDAHISLRMLYYYAFNSRRYCHAVAPGVPQAIIELAYLTSPVDRQWLIGDPDRLAHGLADGIGAFLNTLP